MSIEQKIRSLHCGLQGGLNFEDIVGKDGNVVKVLNFSHIPFELQSIVERWLSAMSDDLRGELVNDGKLTENGWSFFVSWMIGTLHVAQRSESFEIEAQAQLFERLSHLS